MTKRAVLWTAIGTGIAAFAVILFLSSGFRLFAILTPSMGQTAPVGTLVVTHPAETYVAGDVISFERVSKVYTHRIVAVTDDGFTTKGDLNGAVDPLPVERADIIGKAVLIAPGFGWLLRGMPWLLLGGVIVFGLSLIGKLSQTWRWVVRISGWTLVFALVAVWLRPWINLSMLGFVPADTGGGVMMHVVNTGLFPLDAEGTRLVSGEDAVLHITEQNAKGHYTLTPAPALDLWQRLTLLVFCLLPLAASLLVRPEPGPGEAAAAAAIDPRPRRRRLLIGGIVLAVVVSVAAVNQTVAYGSYAAKITNSASSAGTRTFFNCRNALTSLDSSTWFAYAAGTNARNEPDLVTTDPDHPGQYTTAPTLYTGSELGCTRDSPQAAAVFNGARCLYVRTNNTATTGANANIFTLEAWFSTSTKKNGKIVGFGTATSSPYTSGTTVEDHYDRHVYLDKDGRVVFGVYPGNVQIVYTQAGKNYADGKWHHVVATLSPAGQRLFVDGALAMENAAVTTAENFSGYWKVGCGNLSSWRHAATDEAGTGANDYNDGPLYFTGNLQYVAVYTVALTATQAKEHYLAGAP